MFHCFYNLFSKDTHCVFGILQNCYFNTMFWTGQLKNIYLPTYLPTHTNKNTDERESPQEA